MGDNGTVTIQRPDYLKEILSLCSTLSSEAIDAAENRAKANQFNVDRGDITFTELANNLASAREILKDAIESQKLTQLPISVQKELLTNLQAINKELQGLLNNSDEVINLGNSVESLNTSIWKYGLHNLSDQVLGYQTKLNQLKQQDVRAKSLLAQLENGRALAERLGELSSHAESATENISKIRLKVEQEAATAATLRQQTQDEFAKVSAVSSSATQAEAQITQYSSSAKTAAAEIDPLEKSIKGFFGEIDGYRRQITASIDEARKFLTESNGSLSKALSEAKQGVEGEIGRLNLAAKNAGESQQQAINSALEQNRTAFTELQGAFNKSESERVKAASESAAAQLAKQHDEHLTLLSATEKKLAELEAQLKLRSEETIEKNHEDIKKLVEELGTLKERIQDQLAQATGYGQFGAFQSRQNRIARGKYIWVGSVACLVAVVVFLTAYIASHAQEGDLHSAAFWIKLSMNLPLGFLITFCTIQYNRERRLEEEYAFKASISVSLTPYRELIFSILEKDGSIQDGTYTKFVVDSVRNVFTSPTDKIYDSTKGLEGVPEKALKSAAELIGIAAKAAK